MFCIQCGLCVFVGCVFLCIQYVLRVLLCVASVLCVCVDILSLECVFAYSVV